MLPTGDMFTERNDDIIMDGKMHPDLRNAMDISEVSCMTV